MQDNLPPAGLRGNSALKCSSVRFSGLRIARDESARARWRAGRTRGGKGNSGHRDDRDPGGCVSSGNETPGSGQIRCPEDHPTGGWVSIDHDDVNTASGPVALVGLNLADGGVEGTHGSRGCGQLHRYCREGPVKFRVEGLRRPTVDGDARGSGLDRDPGIDVRPLMSGPTVQHPGQRVQAARRNRSPRTLRRDPVLFGGQPRASRWDVRLLSAAHHPNQNGHQDEAPAARATARGATSPRPRRGSKTAPKPVLSMRLQTFPAAARTQHCHSSEE